MCVFAVCVCVSVCACLCVRCAGVCRHVQACASVCRRAVSTCECDFGCALWHLLSDTLHMQHTFLSRCGRITHTTVHHRRRWTRNCRENHGNPRADRGEPLCLRCTRCHPKKKGTTAKLCRNLAGGPPTPSTNCHAARWAQLDHRQNELSLRVSSEQLMS